MQIFHQYSIIEYRVYNWKTLYTWWRHQMETFSALQALCAGIHRSPVNSPHKGQCRGALMFSLIFDWINNCINNREAGDLRRYRAHYKVIVMKLNDYSTRRPHLRRLNNIGIWAIIRNLVIIKWGILLFIHALTSTEVYLSRRYILHKTTL